MSSWSRRDGRSPHSHQHSHRHSDGRHAPHNRKRPHSPEAHHHHTSHEPQHHHTRHEPHHHHTRHEPHHHHTSHEPHHHHTSHEPHHHHTHHDPRHFRPRYDSHRPLSKRPRRDSPGRSYHSLRRESGQHGKDYRQHHNQGPSRSSRSGHTHPVSDSRRDNRLSGVKGGSGGEATPPSSRLSVDEAGQCGAVSYAGSSDTTDRDWTLGDLVSGPLKGCYYTQEDTKVLCATDKLGHLHKLFTESILSQTTPPAHVSLLSRDDGPPLIESLVADQEDIQECDLCTPNLDTQESADSSDITLLDPHENAESADVELTTTEDTAQSPSSTAAGEKVLSEDSAESVGSSPSEAAVNGGTFLDFDLVNSVPLASVEGVNDQEDLPQANSPMDGEGMPDESLIDPSVLSDSIPYNTVNETTGPPLVSRRPGTEEQSPPTGTWHSYSLTVSPSTNFQTGVTTIRAGDGQLYTFRGFLLVTKHPLEEAQRVCRFEKYSGVYTVNLKPLPTPHAFVEEDLLLFHEYLLVRLLELYELIRETKPLLQEASFLPLFVGAGQSDGHQTVLPMADVLRYLLDSYQPLSEGIRGQSLKGQLVVDFNRRPHGLRVDSEWHSRGEDTDRRVKFGHCCPALTRPRGKKSSDKHKNIKTQYYHLLSKKKRGKLTRKEHFRFVEIRRELEGGGASQAGVGWDCQPKDLIWFPSDGFHGTGLCYDVVQHTLLLSAVSQHLLIHASLSTLQQALGYTFNDPSTLHRAVTHPSTTALTYQLAEDHVRTALINCGLVETTPLGGLNKKVSKGLKGLVESIEHGDKGVWLGHNEQLEFLGDAVLEYVCSMRLFHVTPPYSVGQLNTERQLLVKNKSLWALASRLHLSTYHMLTNKKAVQDLTEESVRHMGANCVEALLGAVLVDCGGGVEEVDRLYARLALTDKEQYDKWMDQQKHPLIRAHPEGDRHLMEESEELKSLIALEERMGVKFTHILLLARAFTHPSHPCDTPIISGHYQRLEFLGDAILQFLVSKHLYHKFPSHHEGHLTILRMALVHNKQLASLCKELCFDRHIFTSKTETVELTVKLQADVVESFLAALTLDQGLTAAEQFLEKHLFPKLMEAVRGSQLVDANTRLHQAAAYTCKQQGLSLVLPVYKVSPAGGTVSKPEFTVSVIFGKKKIGSGTAGNIREARKLAAEDALKSTSLRIPPALKLFQAED